MLRTLDLFAGIGMFSEGLHRAGGFETVACCEIDDRKRVLLADMVPGVPLYRDVRALTGEQVEADVGPVDVVAGSPPCKDASSANTAGRGVDGEHTGLFFEALRLVRELRPRWVCLENVPGLRTRGADRVIAGLEPAGYACWPLVVGAGHIGAPHLRNRVWIVGLAADVPRDRRRPGRPGRSDPGRAGEFEQAFPAAADRAVADVPGSEGEQMGLRGQPWQEASAADASPLTGERTGLLNGRLPGRNADHAAGAGPGTAGLGRPDAADAVCLRCDSRAAAQGRERPARGECDGADAPHPHGDGREHPGGRRLGGDAPVAPAVPADANGEGERGLPGGAQTDDTGDRQPHRDAPDADGDTVRQQPGRRGGPDGCGSPVDRIDDAPDPDGAGLAFWQGLAGDHGAQLAALERDVGPAVHLWAGGLGGHIQLADGLPDKVARFVMSACGDAVVPALVEAVGRAILAADTHLSSPPAAPAGPLGAALLDPVAPAGQRPQPSDKEGFHVSITP